MWASHAAPCLRVLRRLWEGAGMNWTPGVFYLVIILLCWLFSWLDRPRRPITVRFDYGLEGDKVKATLYRPGCKPVDLKILSFDADLGVVKIKVPR